MAYNPLPSEVVVPYSTPSIQLVITWLFASAVPALSKGIGGAAKTGVNTMLNMSTAIKMLAPFIIVFIFFPPPRIYFFVFQENSTKLRSLLRKVSIWIG